MPSLQCLVILGVTIFASEILASRSNTNNLAFIPPINSKQIKQRYIPNKQINKQRYNSIIILQQSTKKQVYSSDLDTAYEFLAKDRFNNDPEQHTEIKWFDLAANTNDINTDIDISYEVKRMPLYPLGAVHVPHSGENHTLINIEPKNVKMAMVSNQSIYYLQFHI